MKRAVAGFFLLASTLFCQTRSRLAEYVLILQDAPVAQKVQSRAELQGVRARALRAQIHSSQDGVVAALAERKVRVTWTSQVLLNAVFVQAARDREGDLQGIPGVKRVVYLPPLHRNMDKAAGLVNASGASSALATAAADGSGVKIAIIDSGIDQTHAAFQDPSLTAYPAGFPKGDTNYTNYKVIVARSYVALSNDTSLLTFNPQYSQPDDISPRDRVGHGTAIAAIAAGVQNQGPVATIQGIAPKAYLGNYKIFGSPGVIDYPEYAALAKAMQDAVEDGMDIIALPLGEGDPAFYGPQEKGADCGVDTNTYCDPRVQLVKTVIDEGVTVVVAAGNDGNTGLHTPSLNTIHTPGTTPEAITVGATTNVYPNNYRIVSAVHVTGGSDYDAVFSDGPKPQAAIKGKLIDVATLGNDGLACAALTNGTLTGAIALIQRGTCTFSEKIGHAYDAGAIGVIIYQASGSDLTLTGARDTGIPAVMVSNSDGLALKAAASTSSKTIEVTLDPALHTVAADANVVAAFSSRGPTIGTFDIKPELVAPGVGIYTATQKYDPNGELYNATGYAGGSGTSYAVGMVAGAAALVKQQHSGFTPAQIKSALVNTATSTGVSDESGTTASILSAGAGKLKVDTAINATVTAEPATLSFGALATASLPINLTLKLTNTGSDAANLTLAVNPRNTSSAQVTVPTTVSIPAGNQVTVTVTLGGTKPGAGIYEGFIDVAGSGPTLHIPYLYIVPDGVPYNFLPAEGLYFTSMVSDPGWWPLSFRLMDHYGVPVIGQSVSWSVFSGNGSVKEADAQTYALGFAAAHVYVGSQLGDQVFHATTAGMNYDFTATGVPQPVLRSQSPVLNAAGSGATCCAPGSYIAIYGSGLSPATEAETTTYLPVSLATASVTFDGGGLSLPGHLHFVSPGQVNVQIPWEFQDPMANKGLTSVQMKVRTPYASTALYTVPLTNYAPGIFEYSDSGKMIPAAIDVDPATSAWYIVSQAKPAQRGHALELFLNGLGDVSNRPASGEASSGTNVPVTNTAPTVTIGGKTARVDFHGMTPGSIGLYQVNVSVPSDAPAGMAQVVVSIGGTVSNTSSLPVQ